MVEPLEAAFGQFYQGRHDAADAFWWLTRPTETGPSGVPPVQHLFLQVADELERTDSPEVATALREALADLLQADRRAALDALVQAQAHLREAVNGGPGPDPD